MLYFDYDRQTWIRDGIVQRCGHRDAMRCGCYGREHAGERITERVSLEGRPSVNHDSSRVRWPGFGERTFITAGRAVFTLQGRGARYTFRVNT